MSINRSKSKSPSEFTVKFEKDGSTSIFESDIQPTEPKTSESPWLYANSNLQQDPVNSGKWVIRISKENVNAAWEIVKQALVDKKIKEAKVSRHDPKYSKHVIIIYIDDADDINQIYEMYQYLIQLGIIAADDHTKRRSQQTQFKSDRQTKNATTDNEINAYLYTTSDMENWAAGELRYLPNVVTTKPVSLSKGPLFLNMLPSISIADKIFSVTTGSTWRTKNTGYHSKPETADVFRAAIHRNGLPMAVMLDGCGRHAQNNEIQQIADNVINTLSNLVENYIVKTISRKMKHNPLSRTNMNY